MALRQFAHANGMAGGIRIAGFDGLDHHLKELLATVLELVIEPVDVADSDNWKDDANQARGSQSRPTVERRYTAKPPGASNCASS